HLKVPAPVRRCATLPGTRFKIFPLVVFGALPLLLDAQTTPGALETEDDVISLDAFEVHGFRSSLASSIEAKRQSGQVIDTITAEQVGQFGDQNVGEAIQRISDRKS